MQGLLFPIIGFITLIGAVTVSVIVVRIATAVIKRLDAARPVLLPPDTGMAELRDELDSMQERLDFLERALLAEKSRDGGLASGGESRT